MYFTRPIKDISSGQKRAGRALIIFFALMLAFTVISRGLDSFTVARVTAAAPSRGTLTHEIKLQGSAEPTGETAVTLPEGFLIKELFIRVGTRVAPGDVVALLDTEYIERKLQILRRELEEQTLANAARQARASAPAQHSEVQRNLLQEADNALERAKQDAESLEKAANEAVLRARDELDEAKDDLREARHDRRDMIDDGYEDAELDAIEAAIDALREDVSAKEWALSQAERAQEDARVKAARGVEDAERGIADAERETENDALARIAQQQKDSAEAEAARLENAQGGLTMTEMRERIAALEQLFSDGGRILSVRDGVVTVLNVKAGDVTTGGGAFLLAGQEKSLFTATGTKKETERLSPGDPVEIELSGRREPIAATVASINAPKETGDGYSVAVELAGEGVPANTPGTLTAVKRQNAESQLLPLTALYSDGGETRGFVFVLRQRDTTMGMQTVVERLDVEIIDRGKSMAAIEGAFSPDDKVITASSRSLNDGDRVRLEKQS